MIRLLLLILLSLPVLTEPAFAQLFGRRSPAWNASNYYEGPLEWGRWCSRGRCSMCNGVEAHNRALGRQWPRRQPAVTVAAVTANTTTTLPQAPVVISNDDKPATRAGFKLETYRVQVGKRCVNGVCYPIYENRQRWVPTTAAVAAAVAPTHEATPWIAAKAILDNVQPARGSVFYDLGCGDGGVLKEAMYTHGCNVYGVDIDPNQVRKAIATLKGVNAIPAGASYRVNTRDATGISLEQADTVYVYLFPDVMERIRWDTLKPGATVIAFQHPVPGLEMEEHAIKAGGNDYYYFTYTSPTATLPVMEVPPPTVDALFLTPSWGL